MPTNAQPTSPFASKPKQDPGKHLYAIAGLWTRRLKIGRTSNVWYRLQRLQANSGEELVLLAWAKDLGDHEDRVHSHFQLFRHHGEWFTPHVTEILTREVLINCDDNSTQFEKWIVELSTPYGYGRQLSKAVGAMGTRRNTFTWRDKVRNA